MRAKIIYNVLEPFKRRRSTHYFLFKKTKNKPHYSIPSLSFSLSLSSFKIYKRNRPPICIIIQISLHFFFTLSLSLSLSLLSETNPSDDQLVSQNEAKLQLGTSSFSLLRLSSGHLLLRRFRPPHRRRRTLQRKPTKSTTHHLLQRQDLRLRRYRASGESNFNAGNKRNGGEDSKGTATVSGATDPDHPGALHEEIAAKISAEEEASSPSYFSIPSTMKNNDIGRK